MGKQPMDIKTKSIDPTNKSNKLIKIYSSAPSYLNCMQLYSLQQKLPNLKLENTNGTY